MSTRDPFELRTPAGDTVGERVFAPLDSAGVSLTVVDGGARNGMILSSALARRANLVGFEPNPEEFRKLVEHSTDAERLGVPIAHFKSEKYLNCALWETEEMRPFFVTEGAGACTLMGQTVGGMTQRMWLDGKDKPYGALHTDVRTTLPIQCKRLDQLLDAGDPIDYLKLDVEGAEYAILKGAQNLLARHTVLVIKTEFVFTPYYAVHPVLGYQHVLLHEHGYRLVDLDLEQPRYSRDRTTVPAIADRRLIYAGDAYFILDPDRTEIPPQHLHRMAIVCIALGFRSLAVSLIRDAKLLSEESIRRVEQGLTRVNLGRRMKHLWNRFPLYVAGKLAALRG